MSKENGKPKKKVSDKLKSAQIESAALRNAMGLLNGSRESRAYRAELKRSAAEIAALEVEKIEFASKLDVGQLVAELELDDLLGYRGLRGLLIATRDKLMSEDGPAAASRWEARAELADFDKKRRPDLLAAHAQAEHAGPDFISQCNAAQLRHVKFAGYRGNAPVSALLKIGTEFGANIAVEFDGKEAMLVEAGEVNEELRERIRLATEAHDAQRREIAARARGDLARQHSAAAATGAAPAAMGVVLPGGAEGVGAGDAGVSAPTDVPRAGQGRQSA